MKNYFTKSLFVRLKKYWIYLELLNMNVMCKLVNESQTIECIYQFIKDRKYLCYSKFIQIMAYNLKAHKINIYLKTHKITWYSTKLSST